jgi:hypothetical protein
MGRRSKVQRSAEEKFAIVMEGLKSRKASGTCRKVRDWSSAVLPLERRAGERCFGCAWGRSAAAPADEEQSKRIKQLERALGR